MEALNQTIANLRSRYAAQNPLSQAADQRAEQYFPGGNTRSVLHFDPFPLTMTGGEGAEIFDLDGHHYVDFVGEFSAGLFGHSNEIIKAAVEKALRDGFVMGAPPDSVQYRLPRPWPRCKSRHDKRGPVWS